MGVSKNNGTPKSSILIGVSTINHPFWGTPIFGNIQIDLFPPTKSIHHFEGYFYSIQVERNVFFQPGNRKLGKC